MNRNRSSFPQPRLRKSVADDPTYEVGYGKPPKHTQFKPGQSGNARGRPREQRNLKTVIKDALKEKITIREGERTRTVTRMDAIVRLTINKALQGDAKSLAAFIQLLRSTGLMDEAPETPSRDTISADDDAILAEFLQRHGNVEQQDRSAESSPAEKSANPQTEAETSGKAKPEDER